MLAVVETVVFAVPVLTTPVETVNVTTAPPAGLLASSRSLVQITQEAEPSAATETGCGSIRVEPMNVASQVAPGANRFMAEKVYAPVIEPPATIEIAGSRAVTVVPVRAAAPLADVEVFGRTPKLAHVQMNLVPVETPVNVAVATVVGAPESTMAAVCTVVDGVPGTTVVAVRVPGAHQAQPVGAVRMAVPRVVNSPAAASVITKSGAEVH